MTKLIVVVDPYGVEGIVKEIFDEENITYQITVDGKLIIESNGDIIARFNRWDYIRKME